MGSLSAVPVELWDCSTESDSRFVPFPLSPVLPPFFSLSQGRLEMRQLNGAVTADEISNFAVDIMFYGKVFLDNNFTYLSVGSSFFNRPS